MRPIAVAVFCAVVPTSALAFDCKLPAPADIAESPDCTQWAMTCGAENALKEFTPMWDRQTLATSMNPLERRYVATKYAYEMGSKACHHFDFVQAKAALDAQRPPNMPEN